MNTKKILPLLCLLLILSLTNTFAQTSIDYQAKGDAAIAGKDYKNALADYNLAIKTNDKKDKKQLAVLYFSCGIAQVDLELFDEALKSYTKAIELDPKMRSAYWNRGVINQKNNKFQAAVDDYNNAILTTNAREGDGGLEVLYTNIAFNQMQLHQLDKALAADSTAISINPGYTRAYIGRADIYVEQQNYKLADSDYTTAINASQNEDVHLVSYIFALRGDTRLNRKLYKDAINDYSYALVIDPDQKVAYWNRGAAYHLNGDYSLAVDNYAKAISYYQGDNQSLSKLYDNKALNELGMNAYDKAIQDDSVAISLDATNNIAWFNKANAYTQKGDYAEGIECYKQMLKFAKDNKRSKAILYYEIANNEYFLNQFDKVVADCSTAISLYPEYADSYYYRAKVYLKKLDKKDQAMADFNKVIALDTSKKTVSYIFSLLYTGKTDDAIAILTNDLLTADNATALTDYYNLACLYAIINKPDEANIYLKKAIDNGYAKKYAMADEDLENIRNTDDYKSTMAGAAN